MGTHLELFPEELVDLALSISGVTYTPIDVGHMENAVLYEMDPTSRAHLACEELHSMSSKTQCGIIRNMYRTVIVGGLVWVSHNHLHGPKWDPLEQWGRNYWRCCFLPELVAGVADVQVVFEQDMLLSQQPMHYSVLVRKLRRSPTADFRKEELRKVIAS